ncbi:hypothetical protein [Roseovarius sp.]|uniref:hypothetical protein n=1 Tax=Roseovarius sp. TaxID=1486281 RepID=UPI003BAB1538
MQCLYRLIFAGFLTGLPAGDLALAAEEPDCTDYRDKRGLDAREIQFCEALSIKQRYLEGVTFVEALPAVSDGRALDVRKKTTSRFSSGGTTEIGGTVSIGKLTGMRRFTLATTNNTLYYDRTVRVSGTVSASEGRLAIYGPVDVNFWEMAALFVDDPIRREPAPDSLVLKGYVVTEVAPGPAMPFSTELMAFGGDYSLLLGALDGEASGIEIELEDE